MTRTLALLVPLLAGACVSFTPVPRDGMLSTQQEVWWIRMKALCGGSFQGRLVEGNASDTAFQRNRIVMRVNDCREREMGISLHVGADHSRTWFVRRTADGLNLRHRHLHEDGTEAAPTNYGGDTRGQGTAQRQEFYADANTARMLPAAATNVWTMEVVPGRGFAYALRREGTDRRFRVEFDLSRPAR
ncbi:MAG: hypothetical protein ICV87_09920 [Gemmatimonadetes bacterium]|nr:hypothetical protein [Gemmatimonadota bacterium]